MSAARVSVRIASSRAELAEQERERMRLALELILVILAQ